MSVAPETVKKVLLLFVLMLSMVSLLVLQATDGNIGMALVPSALLLGIFLIRFITSKMWALIVFLFVFFIIDDIVGVPWSNATTLTEILGSILFGMGMPKVHELFALFLLGWLAVTTPRSKLLYLATKGLLTTMFISGIMLLGALFGAFVGLSDGGNPHFIFMQIRFWPLIFVWSIIGFIMIENEKTGYTVLKVIAYAMLLKGLQGLFNFFVHFDIFAHPSNQYLIDHWTSAFFVVAFAFFIYGITAFKTHKLKILIVITALIPSFFSYAVNDRRASVIAIIFAVATLPLCIPIRTLYSKRSLILKLAAAALAFTIVTWPLPPPIGFISNTVKSFTETKNEMPDSRQKENFNIFLNLFKNPVRGLGLGKELTQLTPMDDVSKFYKYIHLMPHNSLVSFWAFGGALGMAAVSTFFAFFFVVMGRLLIAKSRKFAVFGIVGFCYVWQYLVFANADLGLDNSKLAVLGGLLLGGGMRLNKLLDQQRASLNSRKKGNTLAT